jgi:hypothetical protein
MLSTPCYNTQLYGKRGYLNIKGNPIVNASLITQALEASCLPSQVGITHCKAHQTESTFVTPGKIPADEAAKWAAFQPSPQLVI